MIMRKQHMLSKWLFTRVNIKPDLITLIRDFTWTLERCFSGICLIDVAGSAARDKELSLKCPTRQKFLSYRYERLWNATHKSNHFNWSSYFFFSSFLQCKHFYLYWPISYVEMVFWEGRFYLFVVSMLGFTRWDTYMESLKPGRYLRDYLLQPFIFKMVQRGQVTVSRSHSSQHQSQGYKNTSRSRSRSYLISRQ